MAIQLIDPTELGSNTISFPYQGSFGYASPTNGVVAGGLTNGSDFRYQGGTVPGRYYFWNYSSTSPLYTGFHVQVTDNLSNRILFKWWDSTDLTVQCSLHLTAGGVLRAVTGQSGATLATGTTVLTPGTTYWIDVYTAFAASGTFHVWVDEVSEFNISGDTGNGGNDRIGTLEYPDDDTVFADNVMAVNTNAASFTNNISRIGPTTVTAIVPAAVNAEQNWTLVGAADGATALSERPFDTTSYYEAIAPYFFENGPTFPVATDTYILFDMSTAPSGTIKGLYTTQVFRALQASPDTGIRPIAVDPLYPTTGGWVFYSGVSGNNAVWAYGETFSDQILEAPWYAFTSLPTSTAITPAYLNSTPWGLVVLNFDGIPNTTINQGNFRVTSLNMLVAYEGLLTAPSNDVLSTVATIDHDLLIGMEEDQHHDKLHDLAGLDHSGGFFVKTGAYAQITDADFTITPVNGQVAMTYDTQSGQSLWWVRAGGTWDPVEVTS